MGPLAESALLKGIWAQPEGACEQGGRPCAGAGKIDSVAVTTAASSAHARPEPPAQIRWACIIALVQSAIVLAFATFLVYRDITGAEETSLVSEGDTIGWVGTGTAIFLYLVFAVVIAGAISLMRGHRFGRGPVAMWELILLPMAFYMFQAGQPLAGTAAGLSAIVALVLLFHRRSLEWTAENYAS